MKERSDYKTLKEVEKRILKAVNVSKELKELGTVAGIDIVFSGRKVFCGAVVLDYQTMNVIEKKSLVSDEPIPYSPSLVAFREGPPAVEIYKLLENKPDAIMVDGFGAIHDKRVGVASYVGVMVNKPTIGVAKEIVFGRADSDNVLVDGKIKGKLLITKDYAKPIVITPGHDLDLESSFRIVKHCLKGYKMPLPLHLAHKIAVKLKKKHRQ